MATAALAYSGITVKMLVDQRLDAQLHTMFMVDYQPGAVAHPHDHPFEESYYMLEGEVDVVADGERHTLRAGMSSGRRPAASTRSTRRREAVSDGSRPRRPAPAAAALVPVRARLGHLAERLARAGDKDS